MACDKHRLHSGSAIRSEGGMVYKAVRMSRRCSTGCPGGVVSGVPATQKSVSEDGHEAAGGGIRAEGSRGEYVEPSGAEYAEWDRSEKRV